MLKDTEYAYAVSRIRANEGKLLSTADIEQLITAAGMDDALRILSDKGWQSAEEGSSAEQVLAAEADRTWELLCEAAPDSKELEFLIIENDFHNLKAALKALIANVSPQPMFVSPSLTNPDRIAEYTASKSFGMLPEYLRDTAQKAYELLTSTLDGQLTDMLIDKAALEAKIAAAKRTGSEYFTLLAQTDVAGANMRIALRCAHMGKDEKFISGALAECELTDSAALSRAAARGMDELSSYIENKVGGRAAEAAQQSMSAFEKYCDDRLTEIAGDAKFISLGEQPLAAYWIARTAEIKTVRIILSCKENGIDSETISGRVRALYV